MSLLLPKSHLNSELCCRTSFLQLENEKRFPAWVNFVHWERKQETFSAFWILRRRFVLTASLRCHGRGCTSRWQKNQQYQPLSVFQHRRTIGVLIAIQTTWNRPQWLGAYESKHLSVVESIDMAVVAMSDSDKGTTIFAVTFGGRFVVTSESVASNLRTFRRS